MAAGEVLATGTRTKNRDDGQEIIQSIYLDLSADWEEARATCFASRQVEGSGCGDGAEKEVAAGKVNPHTSICSFQRLLDEVMTSISEIPWYCRYRI
jgi:hypothetical protein